MWPSMARLSLATKNAVYALRRDPPSLPPQASAHLRGGRGVVLAVFGGAWLSATMFLALALVGDSVLGAAMRGQLVSEAERWDRAGDHDPMLLRPVRSGGGEAQVWHGGLPAIGEPGGIVPTRIGDAITRLDRNGQLVTYVVTTFERLELGASALGDRSELVFAVAHPIDNPNGAPLRVLVDPPSRATAPRPSTPARAL